MHHKEHNTLDLLEQFSQKNHRTTQNVDDKETLLFRELGQFMSSADKRVSNSNSTFGIPHFIWYLIMVGLFVYLIKEVLLLNGITDVSGAVSSINKEVIEGTHKIADIKNTANKALEGANTKR